MQLMILRYDKIMTLLSIFVVIASCFLFFVSGDIYPIESSLSNSVFFQLSLSYRIYELSYIDLTFFCIMQSCFENGLFNIYKKNHNAGITSMH